MDDLFDIATSMTEQFIEQFCFEDFWSTYGRIGNKKPAEKAYNNAIKKVSHEDIIRGVTNYQAQEHSRGTERRYIKHASTFLNEEAWKDEYYTEQPKLSKLEAAKQSLGLSEGEPRESANGIFTLVRVF